MSQSCVSQIAFISLICDKIDCISGKRFKMKKQNILAHRGLWNVRSSKTLLTF